MSPVSARPPRTPRLGAANPILVEVTRGRTVESRHRGAACVVDATGALIAAWGDVARPVYPRSAVKPLQALALVESGAADAFAVSEQELALACASHNAEPGHVAVAARWLARLGLGERHLACGAHPPMGAEAARALIRAGRAPGRIHNNCSGKHAGMLTLALHLGAPVRGYARAHHPVQELIRAVLSEMTGVDHARLARGTDGCGVPTYALPLPALARAFARLAAPEEGGAARAGACRRVLAAMTAHPFLVAGTGRFCTAVIAAGAGKVVVKTGAEGVFAAALPGRGLGLALKIDDGAGRAARVATAALLRYLGALTARQWEGLADFAVPAVLSRAGRPVGHVRPARGWLK